MKFGKWLRCAAAATVAGCMMLSMTMPALAEAADVLGEYGVQVQEDASVAKSGIRVKVYNEEEVYLDSSNPQASFTVKRNSWSDTKQTVTFTYEPDASLLKIGSPDENVDGPIAVQIDEGVGKIDVVSTVQINPADGEEVKALQVDGAHNVTLDDITGAVKINCTGDVKIGDGKAIIEVSLDVTSARDVTIKCTDTLGVWGKVSCSGTLEITQSGGYNSIQVGFKQSEGKKCLLWTEKDGQEQEIGPAYQMENYGSYLKIVPVDDTTGGEDADDTPAATAPAANDGSAVVGIALGTAAVWGGYEATTRIILNKLLPEGAAIPKTQAQLAVLLWNTAGQPEPASAPAFADVDDATAKAAQWCTEQGYLTGEFRPAKHVTKFRVIRTWNKAFSQN